MKKSMKRIDVGLHCRIFCFHREGGKDAGVSLLCLSKYAHIKQVWLTLVY